MVICVELSSSLAAVLQSTLFLCLVTCMQCSYCLLEMQMTKHECNKANSHCRVGAPATMARYCWQNACVTEIACIW
jgi:hypothetical protein